MYFCRIWLSKLDVSRPLERMLCEAGELSNWHEVARDVYVNPTSIYGRFLDCLYSELIVD